MKKIARWTICLGLLHLSNHCKTVETMQPAMEFRLRLNSTDTTVQLYVKNVTAKFVNISPDGVGIYNIRVPAMRGGYTDNVIFKSNVHDPADYVILKLQRGEKVLKELSTRQLKKLPQTGDVVQLGVD